MRVFQTSTPNRHLPSSSRFALDTSPLPILKTNPTQTPRIMANMSRLSSIQETSFSNQIDTNAVVHSKPVPNSQRESYTIAFEKLKNIRLPCLDRLLPRQQNGIS
ncbi:uncharacterized protein ACN427_013061 [Glossina fuscipes fuscipes]